MVWEEHDVYQLGILVGDSNGGLTSGIDCVAKDFLNITKHRVNDEFGLELHLTSNSSLEYHLEDIMLGQLSSVGRLIYLWPRVEMEPLSLLIESDPLCSAPKFELNVLASFVILHQLEK
jgi:hypothetical protein